MNLPIPDIDTKALVAELSEISGDRVITSESGREPYRKDESFHVAQSPHAVVQPESAEEIQQIVRWCAEHGIPVVPRGAGTSLEGNCLAVQGGVCIDTARMNSIIKIHQDDFHAVVGPGVTRRQLNDYLKGTGLFFPIDPGANATIGGMVATRASGTNAVLYGSMRENVVNIEVVMADGSLIRTARRAPKSAAGYDLTRLMIGSEGTLGVFTELTIKLYPIPESILSASCTFQTMEGAVNSVIDMHKYGIPVSRVELLDEHTVRAVNQYSKTDFEVAPTLFFEFHGSELGVKEQVELTSEIAMENGGNGFVWAETTEERNRMWRARHDVAYATKQLRPDGKIWATDVCVPVSSLAECINETRRDIDESGILAPIVGHVGDGNFHLLLLVDHENPEEVQAAEALHTRMVCRALELEGTCTGEHGIGYGKLGFLKAEHGDAVKPMQMIKQALDPHSIMNPGKIFS
ncbi:MAG: FAD-binding protein [Gammaproteobacteria bacterium]|nr:FAD-binding protein [Gammaproteobacteria bacterium]